MAVEKVVGIATLSGKGGVGKSVIALNLALALGRLGVKTLLFDAGGGDLQHLTNTGFNSNQSGEPKLINLNANVALYNSLITDSYSILGEDDIERFLAQVVSASSGFECVVFDSLTGAGPVSFTLAGLAEVSLLVSTGDPTAIAGAYLLSKALHQDGLASRCALLFNRVESADEAASLKTRFDMLTERFLQNKFDQSGYIRHDSRLAESVLEQQPLLESVKSSPAAQDFTRLATGIRTLSGLQHETLVLKS